jgi:hypothetical protein
MRTLKNISKIIFIMLGIVGVSSSCSKENCITCTYFPEFDNKTKYTYCEEDFEPFDDIKTWKDYVSYLKNEYWKDYGTCK